MHILLTTYGLLLIFALYCSAQWRSAIDMAYMDTVAIERFAYFRKQALSKIENASRRLYDKYKPAEAPQPNSKAISSKVNSSEPANAEALITEGDEDEEEAPIEPPDEVEEDSPKKKATGSRCTAYLHIGELFTGENPTITEGKGKAGFTLLKNLMSSMYAGQEFYEEAKETIPDFEEQFLRNLFEKTKEDQENKQWVSKVGHLSAVDLDDELQSYVRYKMFTGNKSRLIEGSEDDPGYFPLLEFTSMKKHKTLMSIWLAPRPVLMALFQNPEVVQELIDFRREIYSEIRKNNSSATKQAKEQELRLRFGPYIRDIDTQYIDFQVSGTNPKDISEAKKVKPQRKSS